MHPASAQQAAVRQEGGSLKLEKIPGVKTRNIVFILSDDHRFDALGFLGKQRCVVTPHLDRLAREGAYLKNAFVTTSLCSPSRASILTGLYAHNHRVVDNNNPVSDDLVFFSQYLQQHNYQTAMVGKWHMGGHVDKPQRGFDYWVSFKGQGTYLPGKEGLNVNGRQVRQRGYLTDELTDYAIDFMENRDKSKPFMLYLSHKGVHGLFVPAERDKGRSQGHRYIPPATMKQGAHYGAPMWVQNQRNSWHGVEFAFHDTVSIDEHYRKYAETLCAVDSSVGRVLDYLEKEKLDDNTLVVYMGDNGFAFGEHGLIDKRTAYEASMRVPMLARSPGWIKPGTVVENVVANIDVAATFLEAAGLKAPSYMNGQSFLPLLKGGQVSWRSGLLYEYYWERNFPQTPTIHALRGDRYKYIHYHGVWDTDELYDLEADPDETTNLIRSEQHRDIAASMNKELFSLLKNTSGMYIPLYEDIGTQRNLRNEAGSSTADFPPYLIKQIRK
ncbi:MAG: acetylglucosamine-6-sulfatase [Cytophagaceae bacterium SCN 52-12]|nr:MAG: acetylglucosamine-6-sulfatase [Cytophagaceae bacterium SCN 52-12]